MPTRHHKSVLFLLSNLLFFAEGNPYLPDTVDLRAGAQGFVVSTSVSDFLASENFTSTAPDGLEVR